MWLLGIELRPCGRAGNALNLWAIAPALFLHFYMEQFILNSSKYYTIFLSCIISIIWLSSFYIQNFNLETLKKNAPSQKYPSGTLYSTSSCRMNTCITSTCQFIQTGIIMQLYFPFIPLANKTHETFKMKSLRQTPWTRTTRLAQYVQIYKNSGYTNICPHKLQIHRITNKVCRICE